LQKIAFLMDRMTLVESTAFHRRHKLSFGSQFSGALPICHPGLITLNMTTKERHHFIIIVACKLHRINKKLMVYNEKNLQHK